MSKSYTVKKAEMSDPMTESFREAVNRKLAKQAGKGLPVAKYDAKNNRVYYQYPDGRIANG